MQVIAIRFWTVTHLSAIKILAEVPNKHAAVLLGAQIHSYSIGAESDNCIESL